MIISIQQSDNVCMHFHSQNCYLKVELDSHKDGTVFRTATLYNAYNSNVIQMLFNGKADWLEAAFAGTAPFPILDNRTATKTDDFTDAKPFTPLTPEPKQLSLADIPPATKRAVLKAVKADIDPEGAALDASMEHAIAQTDAPTMKRKVSSRALPAKYKAHNLKMLNNDKASMDEPCTHGSTDRYWKCKCSDSSYLASKYKVCPDCKAKAVDAKPATYYNLLRAGVISFGMARNQHTRDAKA